MFSFIHYSILRSGEILGEVFSFTGKLPACYLTPSKRSCMYRFFLIVVLFFSCNGLFADEAVKLQYQIRSLFYKCEMEMRVYVDDPHMTWYTIGKMAAYDEILQLLEEE